MNDYHKKAVQHCYPFLVDEWQRMGGALSEYDVPDEDIVLEIIRHIRSTTTNGTSRLVQMTCLFQWIPEAEGAAHDRSWTPSFPTAYAMRRAWEEEQHDAYLTEMN